MYVQYILLPLVVAALSHSILLCCSLLALMAETKALGHMGVPVSDTAKAVLEQVITTNTHVALVSFHTTGEEIFSYGS